MNGKILQIQRFCTYDGPGIRTTVFLLGCPLSCRWCHNPETQSGKIELLYDAEKCVRCFRCAAACPNGCHTAEKGEHVFSRAACTACGNCLSPLCGALALAGKETSAAAVLAEVLRDQGYYDRSGGGLTLSGGEPLAQPAFAAELLRGARAAGVHTCVETCGAADPRTVETIAQQTDLFLFDYKETDPARHRALTGADNALILRNLRQIDEMGKKIVLRCPVIPTQNARAEHFAGIAALAQRLSNVVRVEVEPYHTLGVEKYRKTGRDYALSALRPPTSKTVAQWVAAIQRGTRVPVVSAVSRCHSAHRA